MRHDCRQGDVVVAVNGIPLGEAVGGVTPKP